MRFSYFLTYILEFNCQNIYLMKKKDNQNLYKQKLLKQSKSTKIISLYVIFHLLLYTHLLQNHLKSFIYQQTLLFSIYYSIDNIPWIENKVSFVLAEAKALIDQGKELLYHIKETTPFLLQEILGKETLFKSQETLIKLLVILSN